MKILLISPRFPESFWSFRWAVDTMLKEKRAVNPPLGLATLAALSPPDWEVEFADSPKVGGLQRQFRDRTAAIRR